MLVEVLIGLVLLCVALYAVANCLPGDPKLKQLVSLVVVVIFLLWLLGYTPLLHHFSR
jgi:hypothetical protein